MRATASFVFTSRDSRDLRVPRSPAPPPSARMATISTMPSQRPKKMVRYGKAASRSTWSTQHLGAWLDHDRDDSTTAQRPAVVNTTYSGTKVEQTPAPEPTTARTSMEASAKIAKKEMDYSPLPTASEMEVASHGEEDVAREPLPKRAKLSESPLSPPSTAMGSATEAPQDKWSRTARAEEVRARKPMIKRAKTQDIFDVPSDEEAESSIGLRRTSPGRLRSRRNLVDDTTSVAPREAALAPWERPKGSAEQAPSPGQQLQATLQDDVNDVLPNDTPVIRLKATPATMVAPKKQEPLSAAARLALRRKAQSAATAKTDPVRNSDKRADATASAAKSLPRKRTRATPAPEETHTRRDSPAKVATADVVMQDVPTVPASPAAQVRSPPSDRNTSTPHRNARRTALSQLCSTPRTSPQKGLTAPARLMEMLPVDTDSTTDQRTPPSAFRSRTSTPKHTASPSASTPSSKVSPRPSGSLTPKQAQLWSQLLPSDPPVPTPTTQAMRELTLSGRPRQQGRVPALSPALTVSQSDVTQAGRRRTRLVDRLKASAPSSDVETSDEEDGGMELAEAADDVAAMMSQPAALQTEASQSQGQSQGQSQATETGPRITYGHTRSYLPEDNFEDNLLFDLPAVTSQRPATLPRQPGKTTQNSQKSAFDLDDSEDDSQGRMRTVYELRAAGRNNRFAQEVEGLLDDISEHNSAARSRRRSALVELGNKLLDGDFAQRFLASGFESRLFAESGAVDDEIADFLLASSVALLLCAEVQEHTPFGLKDAGAIAWLSGMLSTETDVCKTVTDRKQNMSKAAQNTIVAYAKKLQSHSALWEKMAGPTVITPRNIALRALDMLIGKLRRLGDRSELIDVKKLIDILPDHALDAPAAPVTSSAIAVLEALSSSTSSLPWPAEVVERVAVLTSALGHDDVANNHALFLALRLTLNLTNDNARNCALFSWPTTIQHLLQAIESGFANIAAPSAEDATADDPILSYDLLVLAMGCMINLAEHSPAACKHTIDPLSAPTTRSLLQIFVSGQKKMEDAASLTETNTNVAYGYLAVMLANLCLSPETKESVAAALPGKNLGLLVDAVEEFVRHHERVDGLGDGVEGREVWGAFTERLRGVFGRLKGIVAGAL